MVTHKHVDFEDGLWNWVYHTTQQKVNTVHLRFFLLPGYLWKDSLPVTDSPSRETTPHILYGLHLPTEQTLLEHFSASAWFMPFNVSLFCS